MKRVLKAGGSMLVIVAAAAMAGCGAAAQPAASESTAAPGLGDAKIWFVQSSSAPSVVAAEQGMKNVASELGATVEVSNANIDVAKQMQLINDAVAAGADAIITTPISSEALAPAIERANAAGVCTVALWNNFGSTAQTDVFEGSKGFVGAPDTEVGAYLGAALAEKLKADGGPAGVAILGVNPASTSTSIRIEAFEQKLRADYPAATILDTQFSGLQPDKARSIAQNFLQAHGDELGAIFAAVDPDGTAAADVVADSPYADSVAVISSGGTTQFLSDIAAGTAFATLPLAPVSDGEAAMQLAADCIGGDTEPKVVNSLDLPVMDPLRDADYIITKDNVGLFEAQY